MTNGLMDYAKRGYEIGGVRKVSEKYYIKLARYLIVFINLYERN